MTAIYAFADHATGSTPSAFIGADDLSSHGKKTDKVLLIGGRFLVAIYGSDVTDGALSAMRYHRGFEFTNSPPQFQPQSAAALASEVLSLLRHYQQTSLPRIRAASPKTPASDEMWAFAASQTAHVIVFDISLHELREFDLGYPVVVGGLFPSPVEKLLAPNIMHLFSAARASAPNGVVSLTQAIVSSPKVAVDARLRRDRTICARQNVRLGNLGSTAHVVNGSVLTYESCYSSAGEVLESYYR